MHRNSLGRWRKPASSTLHLSRGAVNQTACQGFWVEGLGFRAKHSFCQASEEFPLDFAKLADNLLHSRLQFAPKLSHL